MIRVGIAGIGFMGMIHHLAYQRVRGVQVKAICSRDAKKLSGDWRGIQGNFGPPGTQMDLTGIAGYASFDDLLADPKIDLVDICLPPSLHADAAVAALKAGKHVFCEKPIALTPREADRMVREAKRANRLLLIGHVLPFFAEYAFARDLIARRKYGALLGGSFKRIISDPTWIKDFYNPRTVGGPVVDLHIHDAHFIRLIAGMPSSVASTGRMRGEVVEFVDTHFRFPKSDVTISATGGVINQQGRGFTHGFEIYLEKATLFFDFAATAAGPLTTPLTLLTPDGKATHPKLPESDALGAFVAELTEVCRSIRRNEASPLLDGELARDALVICERESQSVKSGKPVRV